MGGAEGFRCIAQVFMKSRYGAGDGALNGLDKVGVNLSPDEAATTRCNRSRSRDLELLEFRKSRINKLHY